VRPIPLWRRYARLFGPDPVADVRDELRFHLEAKVEDLLARGWRPAEARQEAERQFGDLRRIQDMGVQMGEERAKSVRRASFWEEFTQDLRYALRTLRKERGFTVVTVLILALGIAANTAVFSVVNTVLFRPLPFRKAGELVWLAADKGFSEEVRAVAGLSAVTYTVDAFQEFERHNQSFQSVTSYVPFFGSSEYTMTGRGEAQPVAAVMVAENFFPMLGIRPERGRVFVTEECQKGGRAAVLLSHAFWRQRFASDPGIVGQSITLNKQAVTVVGVMPATFDFGSVFAPGVKIDVYVPAVMDGIRTWGNTLAVIGRLKPGVSVAQAQAEADVVFPQFRAAHKEWWSDYASTLTGLKEFVSGKLRRSLILLWSAVGLILLIVCVNLSNLQLARATARRKEFAVRSALGAGRGRLARQLLTESVVLAGLGAMFGLGLAYGLTFYLAHQESIALPLLSSVTVDGAALAWTLGIAAMTAILFGLVPAFGLAGGNIQDSLKNSGQGMTTGRRHERLRASLVVSEVALACVLLIGSGLLLRSFLRVLDVDLGFQPSRAGVIKVDYDGSDPTRRGVILEEMLRNVSEIPGVEMAGVADMLPLGRNRAWGFSAKGRVYGKDDIQGALVRIITPGYLGAMGMRVRAGRDFTWRDGSKSERVVLVNEAAARLHWQGDDPVGRLALVNGQDARVVGVIADVREHNLESVAGPEMYLPVTQGDPEGAELVVRTRLPLDVIAPSVKKVLRALNPNQPAAEFLPLQQIVDRSVSPRRFFVMLVTGFAGLGLILASLGIYGVISYSVMRQTQEIGIRMALGASGLQVQKGVVGRALRLAAVGAVGGAVGSLMAAKWISSMLFGTEPTDPVTFVSVVVLLGAVALVAGYIPARRASRIEPMIALRNG
jgi:predicted permease